MENRECEIRILNGTSCAFYRYMHSVKHGVWSINPPECLKSKSEEKCIAKFTKTMGNFYGILQYCVVINSEEYILNARFDIPLLGDNMASAIIGMNIKNDKKQVFSQQNYFLVKHSFDNTYNSKFYINIVETDEGKRFIEYHKKKLKKGLLRILNIRTLEEKEKIKKENLNNSIKKDESNNDALLNVKLHNTYKYQDILDILPLSFIINIKNYDWKKRLRKAHKSLYILIINFTRQTLNLSDSKGMKSTILTEGNWVEFPNEKISSLRCSEFGCNSDGMFSSINGFCKYNFMNESCDLNIFWDINSVNSKIKCNIKNSSKYTIIKNVEIYNECTAIFHILEYYYYPPIKILECRALTNNIINKYNIDKDNIDQKLNVIYQCSINVIRQFCQYLHNNASNENSSNEDLINPTNFKTILDNDYEDDFKNQKSPLNFSRMNNHLSVYSNSADDLTNNSYTLEKKKITDINSLKNNKNFIDSYVSSSDLKNNIQKKNFNLLKKRNGNSNNMYMNKNNIFTNINITSARDFFCYIHGNNYSNNIPINSYLYISWNIGNIIYKNLYNSSENIIINAHSLLSSKNINDGVILKLKIDENNKRIYPSNLIHGLLMNTQGNIYINNEYVILDTILNIFHILSTTLSPIIERILDIEYGNKWIIDSKIPKSNIWEKSKGKNELDIEGIIHLITTFWIDVFEKKIKNIDVLENLQKASIFWANQEIHQFDQEFLKNLIESSSLLLKIFGDYNTAKSIEKLYYNKYSIFNDICVD
ncbi:conserved Plasmodium protein, unknown function [Plasmodium relictum]|uniref:Swt1-like HEPN domain-containing protein n=1 Tax=Plasmodium relictum TaxID=85471 RepID=A0A1J1H6Z0_PLARL|nr:conserved Plasmodium protein, unknown function [Plasmodium relictum]CRH00718.1 conserved Plasmodium protein, unknown function [Plasmodium relictum]